MPTVNGDNLGIKGTPEEPGERPRHWKHWTGRELKKVIEQKKMAVNSERYDEVFCQISFVSSCCFWTLKHEQQNSIDPICVFGEFGDVFSST